MASSGFDGGQVQLVAREYTDTAIRHRSDEGESSRVRCTMATDTSRDPHTSLSVPRPSPSPSQVSRLLSGLPKQTWLRYQGVYRTRSGQRVERLARERDKAKRKQKRAEAEAEAEATAVAVAAVASMSASPAPEC